MTVEDGTGEVWTEEDIASEKGKVEERRAVKDAEGQRRRHQSNKQFRTRELARFLCAPKSFTVDSDTFAELDALSDGWGVNTKAGISHILAWALANRDSITPPVVTEKTPRRRKGHVTPKPVTQGVKYVSAFAGIEALSVAAHGHSRPGWQDLGWTLCGLSQWDPSAPVQFAAQILAKRFPDELNKGDIEGFGPSLLNGVDLLAGGSPCQAFSLAGQRRERADPRGRLTETFMALATSPEAGRSRRDVAGVPLLLWENVHGVLSSRYDQPRIKRWNAALKKRRDWLEEPENLVGLTDKQIEAKRRIPGEDETERRRIELFDSRYRDADDLLGSILAKLADRDSRPEHAFTRPRQFAKKKPGKRDGKLLSWPNAGIAVGRERIVAYRVMNSKLFGAPQSRKRIFLVAARWGDGINPISILFDAPPSFGPEQKRRNGIRFMPVLTDASKQGPANPVPRPALADVLVKDETLEQPFGLKPGEAAYFVRRSDRYARRNPGKPNIEERFPLWTLAALRVASSKPGPEPFTVAEVLAAMPETVEWLASLPLDEKDRPYPASSIERYRQQLENPALPEDEAMLFDAYDQAGRITWRDEAACTMTASYGKARSKRPFVVRREGDRMWLRTLMPQEGEAIMGFPIGWTDIPWTGNDLTAEWLDAPTGWDDEAAEEEAETCADDKDAPADGDDVSPTEGPRFKCLGNSMAVPVMRWLAERIDAEFRRAVASGSYVPSLDAANLRRNNNAFDPYFAPPISPVDGKRRARSPWAWKERPERQVAATAKMLAKLDSDKYEFDWKQEGNGRPMAFARNLLALIAERMDDALIACHRDRLEVVSRSLGVLFVVEFSRNKLTLTMPEIRDQATDDAVTKAFPKEGTKDLFDLTATDDGYEIVVTDDADVIARMAALLEVLAPPKDGAKNEAEDDADGFDDEVMEAEEW